MVTPAEREFAVFRRGQVREDILVFFRNGLRLAIDPDTGELFTEDTIRQTTAPGSRFYIEADAIDLVGQGIQKRDEFLAQQMRVDRSGTAFLDNLHAPQWGEQKLPATGGSGLVTATGNPGTTWVGSTLLGDPFAAVARDPAGNRYQVLANGVADGDGNATLTLVGLDGGAATNIAVATELRWVLNTPPGSSPTAIVVDEDFTGGGAAETDAEFSARLASRIRHKPGAGNDAMIRALARAASNAVEDAFVYPCAMNAGSVLVALTQKRRTTSGPLGRFPSAGTLAAVTAAIVPPGSPFLPAEAYVVVVAPQAQTSDAVVQLAQRKGSNAGWSDLVPFPPIRAGGQAVAVSAVAGETDFTITTDAAGQLPNGVTGPLAGVSLMVWDVASSRFEQLTVQSVEDLGAGDYRVLLATAPAHAIAIGDWISPNMGRRTPLAESVEAYFDSLGPGEALDLVVDVLATRAFRRPVPSEEYPARAGQQVLTFLGEGLGASVADSTLASITSTTPAVPADPIDGPRLVTLGKFAAYDLP